MRKQILLSLLLVLSVLTARGQNCNQVVINNGMSSYHSASTDGVNLTLNTFVSGSDSMVPPPGCPPFNGGQPPGAPRHTANATVTVSSASSNQLQNPNFTSGTAGWQWQQNPGGGGGWVLGQGGLPSPPGGIGSLAVYQGIGTAAVANLQHISVDPGNAVTASVWGLGEPGALGQALLRVDWYGASGNLISVSNSPTPVTNNYVWTHVSFSATAPTGAAYAIVDFAIIGKTTTTGRWFAYGFVATPGQTTSNYYTGCWDCYLSAQAAVTVPGGDGPWDVTYDDNTMCSSAGQVYQQTTAQQSPKITVTSGGSQPYGDTPILNVLVQDPSGGQGPTGTVVFTVIDGQTQTQYSSGDKTLQATAASWTPPLLPVDPYDAMVDYLGDSNYLPGSAPFNSFAITPAPTDTTLENCPNGSLTVTHGNIPFDVTVQWVTQPQLNTPQPTGLVYLYATATGGNTGQEPPVSGTTSGGFPFTITRPLTAGTWQVKASYEGDANYATSSSEPCNVTAQ